MMDSVLAIAWVGVGSALGGMMRYAMTLGFERWMPSSFPLATLTANVAGSFVIGCLAMWVQDGEPLAHLSKHLQRCLMVGVMGGFTTFSSFSLQTLELMQKGQLTSAILNMVLSPLLCLLAAAWGFKVAKSWYPLG